LAGQGRRAVKRFLRDSREPACRVPSSCASPTLLRCAAWPGKAAVLSSASCATAASLPATCLRSADEPPGCHAANKRNERRKRRKVKDRARRLGNYIAEHRLTEQPWPTATQLLLAWLQLYTLGGYQPPLEELFMAEALIGGLVEQGTSPSQL